MIELDKLEYHFKPDLELKYVFTHIEKSSLIKLLNTIFEIKLPLDSDIEICNTEFVENNLSSLLLQNKRADMILKQKNTKFHLEFQSEKDETMGLRVFLYGLYSSMEDIENNVIEFPLSHILYTVSGKNKKGIDSITFRVPRFSIHQNIYENTAITIEYPYTNLLKMNLTEFLSDDFILLSFIYFYQYLKDKRKCNNDKKVKKIIKELKNYFAFLNHSELTQKDKEVLSRVVDCITNDIFITINKHDNITKEVEDMLVREYKTLSDMWVEEAVEKAEKKGIQAFITGFRNVNMTEDTILEQLVLSYGLSKEDALKYLQK